MFGPITVPYGAKMLFNTVILKRGVTFDDIELAVGELCSVVKEAYGGERGRVFHANEVFANKFSALAAMCVETKELGYDMLWQGQAEQPLTS